MGRENNLVQAIYIIITIVGTFLVCWGFWRAHLGPKKGQTLAAFLALVGLFMSFLGILLYFVPGFFT